MYLSKVCSSDFELSDSQEFSVYCEKNIEAHRMCEEGTYRVQHQSLR